jgi:hypothetical protein
MRSLWRMLALQWLGGDGSEGLAGDSTILESLTSGEHLQPMTPAFSVRREPGVSHRAMMSPISGSRLEPEITSEEALRPDMPRHYPC